ncbi:hypothetical protein [Lihuaxuella thermophila]|uniref:Uncharacterized protein n=1 Tax=Lihuaxuella thermophila TaxID=1173111 RepID=A0A1H8H3S1_9BACL|nr:hypothetical protein [Lihuaxuella thermophila]SEN51031.1 hypothetical protein SAMN05444955_11334 [Lihuaxuella thermophila]
MSAHKPNPNVKGSRNKLQSNLEKRLKELDDRLKIALAQRALRIHNEVENIYRKFGYGFPPDDEDDDKPLH